LVLGSSVAQGFSATSKLLSWHALLEDNLRRKLGKPNLYVFNAAMGSYNSFQDKLAFYLAAAPRVPMPILFYNGGNDMQVLSDNRAGDPAFLGAWYGAVYGDRLILWIAEHSAIANTILQQRFANSFIEFLARIEKDDALFEHRANAAITLYLESMSEILAVCEAEHRPCWVGIHPNRALTSVHNGGATPDVISARRMEQIYAMLKKRLANHRYREHFIDLTHVFDGAGGEGYFVDTVHVADKGQPLVAEALASRIAPALANPLPRGRTVDRCAALPQPELLANVPLDRVSSDRANTQVSYADGVLSLHVGSGRWEHGAHAAIELDPAWQKRDIIIRVRLAVRKGDIAVVVTDAAASKEISPERSFKAVDEDATAYLRIWGHHRRVLLIFKRTLPDGSPPSDVVVREISVLAK
jgi:hypothetical protein